MPVFVKAGGIVAEQAAMSHVGADPSAPTTLRVYPGASGAFTLYEDAGTGDGYLRGQSSRTPITTSTTGARTTVRIGPAIGRYPGEPGTRSFSVQVQRVTAPHVVFVDGRRVASSYDAASHTLTVPVSGVALSDEAVVTEVGGTPVTSAEPAAVDLSIDPSTPLSLPAGGSATVKTTEHDAGPGTATGVSVTLTAPADWTVKPAAPVSAGDLASGASATTQSWTVTAPSGGSSPVDGTLVAQTTYDSAGRHQQVTASQQGAPAPAPLPPPVITSANPSSTAPGTSVTLTGQSFGATQGSSYLTLAQGGTSWGAPYDGAKLTITSWSDTSITFQLPPNSGSSPLPPGSATVTVTVGGQTSNTQTITVT